MNFITNEVCLTSNILKIITTKTPYNLLNKKQESCYKNNFRENRKNLKLIKKIPLKLKGKLFKTKQFDSTFPTPLFEDLRKTGDLKFKTENDEFLVFVLD